MHSCKLELRQRSLFFSASVDLNITTDSPLTRLAMAPLESMLSMDAFQEEAIICTCSMFYGVSVMLFYFQFDFSFDSRTENQMENRTEKLKIKLKIKL